MTDTAGQTDVTIGRSVGAVTGGGGRESATDFVLTFVRQYEHENRESSRSVGLSVSTAACDFRKR
ncbi:hypothetical protein CYV19_13900 [Natronobacterium gregoryi SP2]|uniref:Uncharacterized protein n=1 Tax=Natronobacterium gregoryi (strain ATCC 43098 / DSM 3393 / CCM 3738 / CIP 104747 / IAM 13177 / JCM 8860 / NBRC 102187 / NCIMB 2189 / SP2) TaxID=797304 RepID=A0A2J4JCI3_NATGS|nr:hypothetical protein CYV19_13900 [Natronobacterium gregoryi SP2]